MAKNFSVLQSVMVIFREVFKLPHKINKKIFFFIFLSTFIPYFPQFLATIYPRTSVFECIDFPIPSTNSTSSDDPQQLFKIKEGTMHIILREVVLFFLMSVISFFSMVTTIYVSAMSYLERDLKLEELFLKIKKIWFRPMITWFYSAVLVTGGFIGLAIPVSVLVTLMKQESLVIVIPLGIVLAILAIYLYMYLTLVWELSIVTSVLENCYGLQAIAKGAQLLKGRKAVGFVLKFVLMIPFGVITALEYMMNKNILPVTLNLLISICGTILSLMMYAVFYLDCKHSHGEDIADEENMGYYTKVSTFQLVDL